MNTEILIVSVEVPAGAVITKGLTHSLRPGFVLPVLLKQADGVIVPSSVRTEKKKDIPTSLARMERSIAGQAMFASYNEKGEFWGTVQKWASVAALSDAGGVRDTVAGLALVPTSRGALAAV